MLAPGHRLHDRYVIENVQGRGGMGSVYRALDLRLSGRVIAIKEMRVDSDDPDERAQALEQFKHEAEILATLQHPALVPVTDFFEEDGRQYLVMAYVDGDTLEKQAGTCLVASVLDWIGQLCEVLDFLHSQQPPVIFRDLKPSNVMLDAGGRIRLIDFGIARAFGPRTATFARGIGSPGFAPLEQYGNVPSDPRTDIYALGATAYALLTGQTPPAAVDVACGTAVLVPPSQLNAEIPPHVDALILKLMGLRAPERPACIGEVQKLMVSGVPLRGKASLQLQFMPQAKNSPGQRATPTPPAAVPPPASPDAPPPRFPGASPANGPPTPAAPPQMSPRHNQNIERQVRPFPGLPGPIPEQDDTRALLRKFSFRTGAVAVVFRPGSDEIVVALQDGHVAIVRLSDGTVQQVEAHRTAIVALAALPGRDAVVSQARDGSVSLLGLATGSRTVLIKPRPSRGTGLAVNPRTPLVACASEDGSIDLVDVDARKIRKKLTGGESVRAVCFTHDARGLVVARRDRRTALVEISSGEIDVSSMRVPLAAFNAVDAAPGGLVALGAVDGSIYLQDADAGAAFGRVTGHGNEVAGVRFSRGGELLASASWDRTVRVWVPAQERQMRIFRGHTDSVSDVAWSADGGRLASAGWDCSVHVWELGVAAPLA
ncbi:MAG: hypothetical protein FJX76_17855 [Armatimonadetes bacterium]|nr:hypothetical protein [Armatimonadota bacterium]